MALNNGRRFAVDARFEFDEKMWTVTHLALTARTPEPVAILESDDGDDLEMPVAQAMICFHDYHRPKNIRPSKPVDTLSDVEPRRRDYALEKARYLRIVLDGAIEVDFGVGDIDRYHPLKTDVATRTKQLIADMDGFAGYSKATIHRDLNKFGPTRDVRLLVPYGPGDATPTDPRDDLDPEVLGVIWRHLQKLARPGMPKLKLDVRVARVITAMEDKGIPRTAVAPSTLERVVSLISYDLQLDVPARQRNSHSSRAITGYREPPPCAPGQRVEIDSTQANVWVRCPHTGHRYRPWFIVLICVVTRLVVIRVTPQPPRSIDWRLTLFDAVFPITAPNTEREAFQLPIGVPENIRIVLAPYGLGLVVNDHGGDIENYAMSDCVTRWGGEIEYAATRTGSHKGYVENANGVISTFLEYLDGNTGYSVDNKADPSVYSDEELPTLETLRTMVWVWANQIRPFRPHAGLLDSRGKHLKPIQAYNDAIKIGYGPRLDVHRDDVFGLLDAEEHALGSTGVKIGPRLYVGDILKEIRNRRQERFGRGGDQITTLYHADDVSRRFVYDEETGSYSVLRAVAADGTTFGPFSDITASDVDAEVGRSLWTRGERNDVNVAVIRHFEKLRDEQPARYAIDRARVESALPDPLGTPGAHPPLRDEPAEEGIPIPEIDAIFRDIPDEEDELF